MLIGHVSDERDLALADVLAEFHREGCGEGSSPNGDGEAGGGGRDPIVVRSTPRGAIRADLEPGEWSLTLAKEGFGSKTVRLRVPDPRTEDRHRFAPRRFRLLSDGLSGYVWPRASRAGEFAEFRVHSTEPYRLSLYRHGLRREFERLLGWFDEHGPRAVMQITPDGDYARDGVQWNRIGYGSAHHGQRVAAPERSGLYYFHAKGEVSGRFFAFPWVVAPARPTAPMAVLASTNTWLAYNNFGGRSNYVNANRLPEFPVVNARQDMLRYSAAGSFHEWGHADQEYEPLSFDRPEPGNSVLEHEEAEHPIRGRLPCAMAPAEWRLLAWLEREGFAHDYYSEDQLHFGELDLDAYRVLVLSVHPEYWSREMYRRVASWVRERGGRLVYLGGNGLNCEVEFLGRDRLRFKTHLAPSDGGALGMPDPRNPERYLESRFHRSTGESEASLLGVVCTAAGIMTAAPYRVVDPGHWAFEGTGLRAGDLFGRESLHERVHGGASGHETDKTSPHSPPGTRILAKGLNPDDGGAEMVHVRFPSGGEVFSVGSITYVASLLVDDPLSRITANVLRRFLEG